MACATRCRGVSKSRTVAAALVLAVVVAGCANDERAEVDGSPNATPSVATADRALVGDPGACTGVDAPMLDVPTASDTEPQIRVPQPPGWQGDVERSKDSEAIRFALRDTDLAVAWRNVAVIALEPVPDLDVQTLLDHELARQVKFFDEQERASMTTTRSTVCGLTAQKTTRRNVNAALVTSVDVVTKTGGHSYIAGITVATEENNDTYRRDAETIVAGFQVLPPAAM
jgi:hypothetical protein